MDTTSNNAETYDFVHPEHKIKSEWPILNLISKKLASELESNLLNQFQFSIHVASQDAKISKYRDIFSDVGDATMLFEVSLHPLTGSAWLCVDRSLVYALTEKFFGGKAGAKDDAESKPPSSILSHTENRLCKRFIDCLHNSIPVAWNMIQEIQNPAIERISMDRLNHSFDDQVVVVCDYDMNLESSEFKTQLIYSHSMLEPHQKKLQKLKKRSEATNEFSGALKAELMNCEIDMHAVLAETKISLAEFLELKTGDFIPLREIENVAFKSNSKHLFDARVGKSNGQVSACVSRWCAPSRT